MIQQHSALLERRKNEAILEAQRKIAAASAKAAEDVAAATASADEAIAELNADAQKKIEANNLEIKRLQEQRKLIEENMATSREWALVADSLGRYIDELRSGDQAPPVRERGSITIVVGEWYLAVYCDSCRWSIPLRHDPSRGRQPAAGDGVLRVTCRCGQEADYSAQQVVSLQAVEEGSLPGPRQQE